MYISPKHPDYAKLTGRQKQGQGSTAEAPRESGERLATFGRSKPGGSDEELRMELAEFQGRPFVSLRVWFKSPHDGIYYPSKKGVTLRMSELDDAMEALATARRLADQRRPAPARKPRANNGRTWGQRPPEAGTPQNEEPAGGAPTAAFDEFGE